MYTKNHFISQLATCSRKRHLIKAQSRPARNKRAKEHNFIVCKMCKRKVISCVICPSISLTLLVSFLNFFAPEQLICQETSDSNRFLSKLSLFSRVWCVIWKQHPQNNYQQFPRPCNWGFAYLEQVRLRFAHSLLLPLRNEVMISEDSIGQWRGMVQGSTGAEVLQYVQWLYWCSQA